MSDTTTAVETYDDPNGGSFDGLTPTQYLIMETLAARFRLGEHRWPFPNRLMAALNVLAGLGLISHQSDVTEGNRAVWLTEPGIQAWGLHEHYLGPNERQDIRLQTRYLGEIIRLRRALAHEADIIATGNGRAATADGVQVDRMRAASRGEAESAYRGVLRCGHEKDQND